MEVTDRNFEEEVLRAGVPVLVEFWASWCLPCKAMDSILEELEREYEGRLKVCKLNVDRNKFTAKRYGVEGVPTFMVFKGGEVMVREVGAKSRRELQEMAEKNLS